jgi:hypothetical protein
MSIVPHAIATVLATDMRPDADGHEGSRPDGLHWYLRHRPGVTPVINDPAATRMMASAALVAGGPEAVRDTAHSWGGDTFGWYQGLVPGCYARLGTHWPGRPDRLDLHRPTFDVDESAIAFGTRAQVLATVTIPLDQAGFEESQVRSARQTAAQRRLEIEREALRKETDQASEERLIKLEKELADLKEQRTRLQTQWEQEKAAIQASSAIAGDIEQVAVDQRGANGDGGAVHAGAGG